MVGLNENLYSPAWNLVAKNLTNLSTKMFKFLCTLVLTYKEIKHVFTHIRAPLHPQTLRHYTNTVFITSPTAGVRSIVISVSVCLNVCLFVRISQQELSSSWDGRPFRKRGLLCPFQRKLVPSNTMWPGSRFTSMTSFILIHPTGNRLARIHQSYRQAGQDNGPIA